MRAHEVTFEFVEQMPPELRNNVIYASLRYRTTAHLCLCGCREKVVNPIRPHRWTLTYDGETISLHPSVGNSGIPCKSHYWISRNRVRWFPPLTDAHTERAMGRDGWQRDAAPKPEPQRRRRPIHDLAASLWRSIRRQS